MSWGEPGKGKWITVYANAGHVFMEVAGIRFDTSGQRVTGSRWQNELRATGGRPATRRASRRRRPGAGRRPGEAGRRTRRAPGAAGPTGRRIRRAAPALALSSRGPSAPR